MADNPISVSVVINTPVERVWPLLVEQQEANRQEAAPQKYWQSDPAGPPVAGQVAHMKFGFLQLTIYIDQIVETDTPMRGQTIYARISFLKKMGEIVASWMNDPEHYHIQAQAEVKHPWLTLTQHTNICCVPIDANLCVIVHIEQSEMTFRLLPRWLTQRINNDEDSRKIETRAIERTLHKIKAKAEQNSILGFQD